MPIHDPKAVRTGKLLLLPTTLRRLENTIPSIKSYLSKTESQKVITHTLTYVNTFLKRGSAAAPSGIRRSSARRDPGGQASVFAGPTISESVNAVVEISRLKTYRCSHKESINAASDRCGEYLADLQADEKGEGHDYSCV